MYAAGCDLGSISAKCVIMQDERIITHAVLSYKTHPRQAAIDVFDQALARAGLSPGNIAAIAATGFGRKAIAYTENKIPDITALSRGVRFAHPDVRTVIEVGGQSVRIFTIGDNGKIRESSANEKCADGTGRFIDVMARALEADYADFGRLTAQSANPVAITSQCGVFSESEVVTAVNEGREPADIFAGICESTARKIVALSRKVDLRAPILFTGGVARNSGVVQAVERNLGMPVMLPEIDPQIFPALGAAIMAREMAAAPAV